MNVKEAIAVLKQFKEEGQKHKDSYTPIGSNLSPVLKIMQDTYQENIDAFEMAIKSLERTRWIPVSERLPDEEAVYVIYDGVRVIVGFYSTSNNRFWYLGQNMNTTHWMPLPDAPGMTREEGGHWDGIAPEEVE